MKLIYIILFFLYAFPVLAAEPSAELELTHTEQSPNKDISINYYSSKDHEVKQVWLVSNEKNNKQYYLLYKFERSVDVLFSTNEKYIIINDFLGSNVSEVHLYKLKQGIEYTEIEDAKITEKTWEYFNKQNKLPKEYFLFHNYIKCIQWSADSNAFLIVLWGHEDGEHYLDNWLCVYDVKTLQPTMNLNIMNRGSVHIKDSKSIN